MNFEEPAADQIHSCIPVSDQNLLGQQADNLPRISKSNQASTVKPINTSRDFHIYIFVLTFWLCQKTS